MGIPYGTEYTATATGSTYNQVDCENCSEPFVYKVERSVSASQTSVLWLDNKGAKKRSQNQASSQLKAALRNAVDPVACPKCGWFQANMCKILKRRRLYIALGISLPLGFVLFLWGLFKLNEINGNSSVLISLGFATAGVGVLIGFVWSFAHKPNAAHPGEYGENSGRASQSRGIKRVDLEAAHAKEVKHWEEQFHRLLLQSMLHMSSADGSIDDSELDVVSKIYLKVTGDVLSADSLRTEARNCTNGRDAFFNNLKKFSVKLTDEAKVLYIRAGVAIAAADGKFDQSELKFLTEVANGLNMTQQQFDVVLAAIKSE